MDGAGALLRTLVAGGVEAARAERAELVDELRRALATRGPTVIEAVLTHGYVLLVPGHSALLDRPERNLHGP